MKQLLAVVSAVMLATGAAASPFHLSDEDRALVTTEVINHLRTDYVDEGVGNHAARQLEADLNAGRFDALTDAEAFAETLSSRLQELTEDGHLNVEYASEAINLSDDQDDTFSESEMERYYGAHLNYGVQTVARLDGNIGYLDLRVFAPIAMGGNTVTSAMNVVANTDALIIDLRKNGGGIGDMADLVASYLFSDERQPLTGVYDRPSDTLTQRFTQAYVRGQRFGADKPIYVLISSRTFSAAEALAYNLQALNRATIVGERSAGGAHPFEYRPVHAHFVLWSVTAKSINPITGGNWQSVGVKPDVEVAADDALETAIALINKDR